MPEVTFQFNKGAFAGLDETEMNDPSFGHEQKNFLVTDAGSLITRPSIRNSYSSAETTWGSVGPYPVIGMYPFEEFVVSVAESGHVYKTEEDHTTTIITDPSNDLLETEQDKAIFADDGTYVAIACGATPKRWKTTEALVEDMPGNPPDCSHIVYLDGYWIALLTDSQEIQWAGPTESLRESWSSGDFIQAEALPDKANALTVEQKELFVWGEKSIEIFQNFGDSQTPFRPSFSIKKGTLSPFSIVQANNTHYFLNRERQFCRLEGRTPVMISSPYDEIVKNFSTVSDCIGNAVEFNNHYLIVWSFPTENRTIVYDYKHDQWCEFSSLAAGVDGRFWMNAYAFHPEWNVHLVGDYRNGNIYQLARGRNKEINAGFYGPVATFQSGYIDHGTANRKRNISYVFYMKRGTSSQFDMTAKGSSVLMVRFKDDDKGWSDPVELEIGETGDFNPVVKLNRTGIYRRRQIEIRLTDGADILLNKIVENVEALES